MTDEQINQITGALNAQGVQLAVLAQEVKNTNERLFGIGDTPGIFGVVASHSTTLGYLKGAAGVLGLLWSAAVAIFAAKLKGHH